MIFEIADIRIKAGQQTAFEHAVHVAMQTIFPKAQGFCGYQFNRSIESPERYVLQLTWETIENHTLEFRGSALYTVWRSMVGDFFAQPPHVEHFAHMKI